MNDLKTKRIVAYIIDWVLLSIVSVVISIVLGVVSLGVLSVLGSFIFVVYDPIFKYLGWGTQTPGKKYAKLKVVKTDGKELTDLDLVLRSTLRFFGISALLSLIWWFVEGKTIHDEVLNTKVVEE